MKTYKYRGYRIRHEEITFGSKSGSFKQWRAYFEYPYGWMLCGFPTLREVKEYINNHIEKMNL